MDLLPFISMVYLLSSGHFLTNLFKRSYTNKGIGFTYNKMKASDLFKKSSKNFDEIL